MQISNIPARLINAFSAVGDKAKIPQTTVDAARASYSLGFPPKNMTPVASGGVPPDGRDMNGILYEISNAALWAQAMGVMPFDAAFATDAGYPQGALVQHSGSIWRSAADNNTVTPSAVSANWERMSLEGGVAGQALMKASSKTGDYVWRALAISDVTNLQSSLNGKSGPGSATPLVDGAASAGVSTNAAREDHRHPTDTSRAPLDSPGLTGTPTAPTATAGTNTTQLATTAFVQQEKPATATQAEMEAGTESSVRSMSPLGVAQAIAARAQPHANPYVGGRGQVFTATGNFTVPNGITAIKVRGCGGGGGAAASSSNGGTTSFGSYCSATGGSSGPNGGTGGVATGGDINLNSGDRTSSSPGLCGGSGMFGGASSGAPSKGYGNGGYYNGNHGGGGGYFEKYITGLTPGDVIAVTVGAGGSSTVNYQGSQGLVVVEW